MVREGQPLFVILERVSQDGAALLPQSWLLGPFSAPLGLMHAGMWVVRDSAGIESTVN